MKIKEEAEGLINYHKFGGAYAMMYPQPPETSRYSAIIMAIGTCSLYGDSYNGRYKKIIKHLRKELKKLNKS